MPNKVVPVRLLNPTVGSINLYSGASVAMLSEVTEIMTDHSENSDTVENTVMVSAVGSDNGCAPLEEILIVSEGLFIVWSSSGSVVGTFNGIFRCVCSIQR